MERTHPTVFRRLPVRSDPTAAVDCRVIRRNTEGWTALLASSAAGAPPLPPAISLHLSCLVCLCGPFSLFEGVKWAGRPGGRGWGFGVGLGRFSSVDCTPLALRTKWEGIWGCAVRCREVEGAYGMSTAQPQDFAIHSTKPGLSGRASLPAPLSLSPPFVPGTSSQTHRRRLRATCLVSVTSQTWR